MTDTELKLGLAKLLPEKLCIAQGTVCWTKPEWSSNKNTVSGVEETEWLHVCHMIERKMTAEQYKQLGIHVTSHLLDDPNDEQLKDFYSAAWQQRAEDILKVK